LEEEDREGLTASDLLQITLSDVPMIAVDSASAKLEATEHVVAAFRIAVVLQKKGEFSLEKFGPFLVRFRSKPGDVQLLQVRHIQAEEPSLEISAKPSWIQLLRLVLLPFQFLGSRVLRRLCSCTTSSKYWATKN